MAVKLAAALGADVTVMSRTADKQADALALGADRLLVSSDAEAMARAANGFDLIIDTVPVKHDINPYLSLLNVDATLVLVGQVGFDYRLLQWQPGGSSHAITRLLSTAAG